LTQQNVFQKVSEEIYGLEQQIEETRLESVQLETDLSQDPIRNELVNLYSDLLNLTAKRNEQEREERNKLSPEQEREKLLRQTKVLK
jgi:intraflagellar transport protein 74